MTDSSRARRARSTIARSMAESAHKGQWKRARKRRGTVQDSRVGAVRWTFVDGPRTIVVAGNGLPATEVPFEVERTTALLGGRPVELVLGRQGVRRVTWTSHAQRDGSRYSLRPRSVVHSHVMRDETRLGVVRRNVLRRRITVVWDDEAVRAEELALGHALAAYSGVGAPGAALNSMFVLDLLGLAFW